MADYPLQSTWAEVDAAAQAIANGVQKTYLAPSVQESLEKADGALQKSGIEPKTSAMTQKVGVDGSGGLWTKPGEGGGTGTDEIFWITITGTQSGYSMDCTWADIASAISDGMLIAGKYGDRRFWWNGDPTDDGLQLVSVDIGSSSKVYADAFTISSGGTITYQLNISLNPSDLWLNTLSLSTSEKSKARENIGAGTGNYTVPTGGIPDTDLAVYTTTFTQSGNSYTADHSFSDIQAAIALNYQLRFMLGTLELKIRRVTSTYIELFGVDVINDAPTLYTVTMTSTNISVGVQNIGNAIEPVVDEVTGNTPEIYAPGGNATYKCTGSAITSLTISDYDYGNAFTVIFNTQPSPASVPTVTIDSKIQLPDNFQFEVNKRYEINVDEFGYAVVGSWVLVD